jgi:peptidoglycan hydrolase-like protein with peptidoglycan-binding domain
MAPGTPIPPTPAETPSRATPSASPVAAGEVSVDQVRSAQQALQSHGVNPGPIDGVMGPRTEQAVRDYQRRQNLPETGRLDPPTLEKLGVSSM